MTVHIYGIRNCDTMKKAFAWLEGHHVAFVFHDYKKAPVAPDTLQRWCERLGWQALINTRGTTWRKLTPAQQAVDTTAAALALLLANPSAIRRPVIETHTELLVGFDEVAYAQHLLAARAETSA